MHLLSSEVPTIAHEHAAALLAILRQTHGGKAILVRDAAAAYRRLCRERRWKPVFWHSQRGVSYALRMHLGGQRKTYRTPQPTKKGGKRKRWAVFLIPEQQPTEDLQ